MGDSMDSLKKAAKERIKKSIKKKLKKAVSGIAKKLLASFAGPAIVIGIIFLFVVLLVGAVFIQFTGYRQAYGVAKLDQQFQTEVTQDTKDANTKNVYKDGQHLSQQDAYNLVYVTHDHFHFDEQERLKEGETATAAYLLSSSNGKDVTKEDFKNITEKFSPVLKYETLKLQEIYEVPQNPILDIKSGMYVYQRDSNGEVLKRQVTTETDAIILKESDNIYGHKIYTYDIKWRSYTYYDPELRSHFTVKYSYPDIKSVTLISAPYERLDNFIKNDLKINDNNVDFTRMAFLEAAQGYENNQERLDWLMGDSMYVSEFYVSSADIPAEFSEILKEASQKYGIPDWFIAAVIMKESSFNPMAVNTSTGALGLMQVMPENWKYYAPKLGYDPQRDMFNPRAQIDVGTYLLKNYLGNIDWNAPDWKEQTWKGLAFYGGFRGSDALERCRTQYAEAIWAYADGFRNNSNAAWPVPGHTEITSPFGYRILNGEQEFHPGIDIAAEIGTPVVAAVNGKVKLAGWVQGYGNTIIISDLTHDYLYGHLSKIDVLAGQTVRKGQKIGEVGNTGKSTGPHLHFGVSKGDWTQGRWTDPMLIFTNK